jgi:hypothetical protein
MTAYDVQPQAPPPADFAAPFKVRSRAFFGKLPGATAAYHGVRP